MSTSMRALRKMAPIVVVLGATGTGKSKLAIEIATRFNGEIISADSMQIYKGLDIVTNKVTQEEHAACRHHLIDCVSPLVSSYSVHDFRDAVLPLIDDLHRQKKLPIIVGGTNYYIESLLWKFTLDAVMPLKAPRRESTEDINFESEIDRPADEEPRDMDPIPFEDCSSETLHQRLLTVDPESASRIHPKDRRKIIRALKVYEQTGRTKSRHLHEQQNSSSIEGISGPLRYSEVCMIWVQCKQEVLDERVEKRVDEMMRQGLLAELTEFHRQYNADRLIDGKEADYTLGIFQSIGFKEFHDYLLMSEDERASETGQKLLEKGIDDMKAATRRYARRQLKWIVNRFIKRKGIDVPPIFAVDSTNIDKWQSDVTDIAVAIVTGFLEGGNTGVEPLPAQVNTNEPMFRHCPDCDVVLVTKTIWEAHIFGRRHKKRVESRRNMEKFRAEFHPKTTERICDATASSTEVQNNSTEDKKKFVDCETDSAESQNSSGEASTSFTEPKDDSKALDDCSRDSMKTQS